MSPPLLYGLKESVFKVVEKSVFKVIEETALKVKRKSRIVG